MWSLNHLTITTSAPNLDVLGLTVSSNNCHPPSCQKLLPATLSQYGLFPRCQSYPPIMRKSCVALRLPTYFLACLFVCCWLACLFAYPHAAKNAWLKINPNRFPLILEPMLWQLVQACLDVLLLLLVWFWIDGWVFLHI